MMYVGAGKVLEMKKKCRKTRILSLYDFGIASPVVFVDMHPFFPVLGMDCHISRLSPFAFYSNDIMCALLFLLLFLSAAAAVVC